MLWLARNTYQDTGGQQSAMVVREACPACGSQPFKKNGHIHTGKQNHQCQVCGRQFVLHAGNRVINEAQRTLVARLLREKISLHGICRAVGVSIRWLMDFMVARFQALPDHLHVQPVASPCDVIMGRLEAEADEMWSFVKQKTNRQWVWIAMDQQTRQVIAFHVGDRSRESAKQLWANLPEVYREQARFHTDQYDAYTGVIPAERHKAITKDARKTNHIERFNNTLRQRVSRLVRETLAFSKKVENHIGAIRYFICDYNLTRATALPV
jgi:insertion element IS1 protein InsB